MPQCCGLFHQRRNYWLSSGIILQSPIQMPTLLCDGALASTCKHTLVQTIPIYINKVFLQYPLPSKGVSSSHRGSNADPVILYNVFLEEGKHAAASIALLEGQMAGYFHGKVHNMSMSFVITHSKWFLGLRSAYSTVSFQRSCYNALNVNSEFTTNSDV